MDTRRRRHPSKNRNRENLWILLCLVPCEAYVLVRLVPKELAHEDVRQSQIDITYMMGTWPQ